MADFLYRQAEMSGKKIDELMQLWACTLEESQDPPFAGRTHLYDTIDAIKNGDVPWQRFSISWNGAIGAGPLPSWQVSVVLPITAWPILIASAAAFPNS